MADKKVLWILADNRTGSVAQARGIAQQLDTERYDVIEKKLDYTKLSGLPNFVRADTLVGLSTASKASIKAPWPDLVLSVVGPCPWHAILKRKIRRQNLFS